MNNYYKKYLKYKKKYNDLKGGSYFENQCYYYLPCEITNVTQTLYMHSNIYQDLFRILPAGISINTSENEPFPAQYQQDPAIFLKNIVNNTDHSIIIRKNEIDLTSFGYNIKEITSPVTGIDYGGNFISSPPNNSNPIGTVFYFGPICQELDEYLQNNLCQNQVELSCSFKYNNSRHIDECMCFMPYGDRYKVWIYGIRDVEFSTPSQIPDCQNILEKLISEIIYYCSKYDEQKKQICNNLINYLNNVAGSTKPTENLNFVKNKLSELSKICLKIKLGEIKIPSIDQIKANLLAEQFYNHNLISRALYGVDFVYARDNFVIFPIDIIIDNKNNTYNDYKIKNIPVFNRLWCETPDTAFVLFSAHSDIPDYGYDLQTKQILEAEIPLLKSGLNSSKPTNVAFLNTTKHSNISTAVGGNVHCLIKNKY